MKSWEFMNLGKFTNFNVSFFPFDTTLVYVWNLCHYRWKARVAICCWLAKLPTCWNNSLKMAFCSTIHYNCQPTCWNNSLKMVFCSTIQYNCQPTCWNNSLNMVYFLYSTFKAHLLKQFLKNGVLVVLQTFKAHFLIDNDSCFIYAIWRRCACISTNKL